MEERRRITLTESYPQEAVVGLDPLLQVFNDENDNPIHRTRRSSVFYIPVTVIHENNEENQHSNRKTSFLERYFSYMERFSGIMYSLTAALLLACSNFALKQFNVVLLDVFLIRLALQGFISFGYIIYKGYHPFSPNSYALLTFIQSLIAGAGTTCLYLSLALLPVPDFSTIRHTQVVWTALLTFIVFRERITLSILIACILTLIGVICIAQPSFIFRKTKNFNETLDISLKENNENRLFGMVIGLLCAILLSISVLLNKKLLQNKIHQSIILLYFFISTFTFLLIIQIHYWVFSKTNPQKFHIKIYLTKTFIFPTLLATLQIIPMILAQKAIKREHPSIISVIQATEILFSIILQNIFSIYKSNSITLIGSTLVLISIIILCAYKLWKDRYNRTYIPTSIQENI